MLPFLVLLGLVASPLAAPTVRATQRAGFGARGGLLFALVPAVIAAWLAWAAPGVLSGEEHRFSLAWIPSLGLELSFRLDGLSLLFALLISGIGTFIFVYACGYMGSDEGGAARLGRLLSYLLLFKAAMLGVVLADNVLTMFLFWEMTSIASYLLVGFDHEREKARKSALQALLVTGMGGLALLAGLVLLGNAAGTFELSAINAAGPLAAGPTTTAIVILVLLGAFTKSAQFPFHFWLPNAMEAPSPVSAYLHSSTMVKAGIYLVARLHPSLGDVPLWEILLVSAGAATMLVGGVLALRSTALKKLLAYSTVASLGTIMLGLGIGTEKAVFAAMAFLLAHAFYKATLFLVAGAITHETGEKDAEAVGGLRSATPVLFAAAVAAAFAMAGVAPSLAFIAKEYLLEGAGKAEAVLPGGVLMAVIACTAAAMVVVALMTGLKPFIGRATPSIEHAHEPPPSMLAGPLLFAAAGLLLGVAPFLGALQLVRGSTLAVTAAPTTLGLELWHGWTIALFASLASLAAGAVLFVARDRVRAALAGVASPFDAVGPARLYDLVFVGTLRGATLLTSRLQNGSLRVYSATALVVAIVAVGGSLLVRRTPLPTGADPSPTFYVVAVAGLVIVAAAVLATAQRRLLAVAALSLVGLGVSCLYVLFGAPDLAMTQIAVDSLSIVLLLAVFRRLPDLRPLSQRFTRLRDACIALAVGTMMGLLTLYASRTQLSPSISSELVARSVPEGYGRNVVNVILVDFRALDTLGEITVVAMAALGVFALIRLRTRRTA